MLIVPIYVNSSCIDMVRAHNMGGPMDGVCKYELTSQHLGDMGIIKHDRTHGVYKLIEKIMKKAYEMDETKKKEEINVEW